MRDFAIATLELIPVTRAEYGDVRVVLRHDEHLRVKNGGLEAWSDEETLGFAVRVLVDGAWGFAASRDLTTAEAERVVAQAVAVAKASADVGGPKVRLAPQRPHVAEHDGPCLEDPFSLSPETKIAWLLEATAGLAVPGVTYTTGRLGAFREEKVFASTEGAVIVQRRHETGGEIAAIAVGDGDVQQRSYPSRGGHNAYQGGFEVVRALDLAGAAQRLGEEAVALLTAPSCPEHTTTVVLDAEQVALQVHESVGHPAELDRILGSEAAYAGTSFLGIEDLGNLRYGSEHMTVVADATTPGGLGSIPFDDEGVPAKRVPLVTRGLLTGFLTSRETAVLLGQESGGAMRADGWNSLPLIRMTNINLEPGAGSLDELIADTDQGVLLSTNKSWSIDDRRLDFHFGTEIAWEIKKGRLGRMLRDSGYQGRTPVFWRSLDAVCGPQEWRLFGFSNCGKGQPGQVAHVGHGAAPARFRDVRVGVSG